MTPTRAAALMAALVLAAGCVAPTSPGTTDGPTSTAATEGSPTPAGGTATYAIRAGPVPDGVASLEVTVRAVLVDDERDLGPCYPGIYSGPYEPTITPLATPAGDCRRSEPVTVEVAALEGDRRVATVRVPPSVRGHALVVTEARATWANGSAVAVKGAGGEAAIEVAERPSGGQVARIGLTPGPDAADYDYFLVAEPVRSSPTASGS